MVTSPISTAMHYFVRANGMLREVHPLTKPNRENPLVTVKVVASGALVTVHNTEIIRSY